MSLQCTCTCIYGGNEDEDTHVHVRDVSDGVHWCRHLNIYV